MKSSLQEFGQWGTNFIGQASTQLAPAAAAASSVAKNSFSSGVDMVKSGAKVVKSSIKENLNAGIGQSYTFQDDRDGTRRVVSEIALIAEGGFGAVFRVRDQATGKEYALKKIRCQNGVQIASTIEAAQAEAKLLLSFGEHPNIIQCKGFVTAESKVPGSGTVSLLLELCSGGTLMDYMDTRKGKLLAREIMEPMVQLTEAVRFLHSQTPPIQHRDLKVENVLRKKNDGAWKLCDFGSCSRVTVPAKEFSRKEVMEMQEEFDKTVTMLYRPPEMADVELNVRNGYEINERVDMWMLGCILFTLSFYRHPFQDNATPMAICNAKYFIPQEHPMAKSAKLCGLIHWLLAANPMDRPTASHLCEVFENLGKYQIEDLYALIPAAVHEKMKRLQNLFGARKDLKPPTSLEDAIAKSGSVGSRRQSADSHSAPRNVAPESTNGGFDINDALTSSPISPCVMETKQQTSTAEPANTVISSADDLLSWCSPSDVSPPTSASQTRAPSASTPCSSPTAFDDLLAFDDVPKQSTPVGQVPNGVSSAGTGDLLLDFAPIGSAGTAPTTRTDNFASGHFASVPTVSPAVMDGSGRGGYGDASINQFANFAAASPTHVNGSSGATQVNTACMNEFADFANFSSAPSPTSQEIRFDEFASPPVNACTGSARTGQHPANDNLLDLM